jgi:hypothetical protein
MLPVMQLPAGQNGYQSDDEAMARGGGFAQRNRLIVGVGILCLIVGVPLVSLPDGTALSVLGLCLVTIAGACVISFVYRLAGDDEDDEPGPGPHPDEWS